MLSPKQIGTICFTIFLLIFPAFATDPDIDTATASCSDDVFNSNTGPVNIEVNWEPNEINLRWYNNNTLITTSNNASNTCTYDENDLTIPAAPTRTGYTFKGWRARSQIHFSVSQLGLNRGVSRYGKGVYNNEDYCNSSYQASNGGGPEYCATNPNYMELQRNEWKIIFQSGVALYGMSGCSTQVGSAKQRGTPPIDGGKYCWCKATGYKDIAGPLYGPDTTLYWMYLLNRSNAVFCARDCATLCAYYISGDVATRNFLFSPPSDD